MSCFANPNIIKNGLILYLDAGNTKSYPGSGTTWTDLSGNGYNFTIQSGSWVSAGAASYFNFSGSYCCAKRVVGGVLTDIPISTTNTLLVFTSILNSTATYRTLIRQSGFPAYDHQVLTNSGSNDIGYYNNTGGTPTGYISASYSVSSITNYTTAFNCLHWKFANTSPYWTFGWNNNFGVASITSGGAIEDGGFCAIGGHPLGSATVSSSTNAQQYWGNVALVMYYNRTLSDSEIKQNYNALRGRFGI